MSAKSPFKFKCDSTSYNNQELHHSPATVTNHKMGSTHVQAELHAVGDEMKEIQPDHVCSVIPGPNTCSGETLSVGGTKKLLYNVNINNTNYYIKSISFYNAASEAYINTNTRNRSNLITVTHRNKSILFNGLASKKIKQLYKN